MSLAQANKEKTKVKLAATDSHDPNNIELLPDLLRELIVRSQQLHMKVRRLDNTIHNIAADQAPSINPVEHQLGLLKAAFGVENA
jgi:regulator of CtrA degradation